MLYLGLPTQTKIWANKMWCWICGTAADRPCACERKREHQRTSFYSMKLKEIEGLLWCDMPKSTRAHVASNCTVCISKLCIPSSCPSCPVCSGTTPVLVVEVLQLQVQLPGFRQPLSCWMVTPSWWPAVHLHWASCVIALATASPSPLLHFDLNCIWVGHAVAK